jgi:hypothetical protein
MIDANFADMELFSLATIAGSEYNFLCSVVRAVMGRLLKSETARQRHVAAVFQPVLAATNCATGLPISECSVSNHRHISPLSVAQADAVEWVCKNIAVARHLCDSPEANF